MLLALRVLLRRHHVVDAQVDTRNLEAGHRGQALGHAGLHVVEDIRGVGAVLDDDGDVHHNAVIVRNLNGYALGEVLRTKLLLHKVHQVALHAQHMRHLARRQRYNLLDHAVGIGQRIIRIELVLFDLHLGIALGLNGIILIELGREILGGRLLRGDLACPIGHLDNFLLRHDAYPLSSLIKPQNLALRAWFARRRLRCRQRASPLAPTAKQTVEEAVDAAVAVA